MGVPASSTTAEVYMQADECTAISAALNPPKVWEQFVDDVYSILKRTHLENFFHHINKFHQNIKFTMEEESNGELVFSWHCIESEYWKDLCVDLYIGSLSILTNTYTTSLTASCKESVVSPLFNRVNSIITNKDHLYKENARMKQVLNENGYQERIISKMFKRITYNHSKKRKPQISEKKRSELI